MLSECGSLLPLSVEPLKAGRILPFSKAAANRLTPETPCGRENYAESDYFFWRIANLESFH
jgi:hypothetical protein